MGVERKFGELSDVVASFDMCDSSKEFAKTEKKLIKHVTKLICEGKVKIKG